MGITHFQWDEECQIAFENLKTYQSLSKLLTHPEPGDELQVYLSVSHGAVSSVLIKEDDKGQRPIHYASHVLHGPEERYPVINKFV